MCEGEFRKYFSFCHFLGKKTFRKKRRKFALCRVSRNSIRCTKLDFIGIPENTLVRAKCQHQAHLQSLVNCLLITIQASVSAAAPQCGSQINTAPGTTGWNRRAIYSCKSSHSGLVLLEHLGEWFPFDFPEHARPSQKFPADSKQAGKSRLVTVRGYIS